MSRCLIFLFVISVVLGCSSPSKYKPIDEFLKDYETTIDGETSLVIFDEYACSICFQNLMNQLPRLNSYKVLYASERWQRFSYEHSQMVGFIESEKIVPVDYSIIPLLRKTTATYKGNYLLELEGGKVLSITALDE
mgnify:CR=1 FL=1